MIKIAEDEAGKSPTHLVVLRQLAIDVPLAARIDLGADVEASVDSESSHIREIRISLDNDHHHRRPSEGQANAS